MNTPLCSHEEEIIQAVIQNSLSMSLEQHLQSCVHCRSSVAITKNIQTVRATALNNTPAIPHPQIIWLKAQYMQKQKLARVDLLISAGAIFASLLIVFLVSAFLLPTQSSFSLLELLHSFKASRAFSAPAIIFVSAIILVLLLGHTSSKNMLFRRI